MLLLLFLSTLVIGEKERGTVNVGDSSGFSFLGKFCFQDVDTLNLTAGTLDVELTNKGSVGSESYYLIMYDDQDNSWNKVYDSGLTCLEKISSYYRFREKIKISSSSTFTKLIKIHQHIRPRWWWLYLANCDDYNNVTSRHKLTNIDYELHFKQNTTNSWEIELGSNDQGINIMYTIYLVLYIILFGFQLYAYHIYRIQQYIHQVIKLLTSTIGLQLFSVLFNFVDWIIFTQTGEHEIFFPILGALCEILGVTIFLLLLLVLGQGWTVSRFEVIYPKLLLCVVIVTGLLSCGLYIWSLIGLDDENTQYQYNTAPEYCYGALFLILGCIFLGECLYSWKGEALESKKILYILLAICFSVWFIFPLLSIAIGNAFHDWDRDVAVQAISLTINTLIYGIMMCVMYPKWAHSYFNLSMTDTQQRILDDASGIGGSNGQSSGGDNNKSADYKVLDNERL